ncbi:WecB/TagA/CpsF family glycosyltransferase, partial [Acinetobacter baumannii]|uniref:WecB/TagA/CpsF family glycosyltransferase n=1 Tax=Acinetobacter baumannii TaxID=470 RepID=UPI00148FBF29
VSIYLYGSSEAVLVPLSRNLRRRCPGLVVAGFESPPFRPLTEREVDEAIARINDSGAGLVFLGLVCPRQDVFASTHKQRIKG